MPAPANPSVDHVQLFYFLVLFPVLFFQFVGLSGTFSAACGVEVTCQSGGEGVRLSIFEIMGFRVFLLK